MASTNWHTKQGPGNEFLEKAHFKTHGYRAVCLTTKFDF